MSYDAASLSTSCCYHSHQHSRSVCSFYPTAGDSISFAICSISALVGMRVTASCLRRHRWCRPAAPFSQSTCTTSVQAIHQRSLPIALLSPPIKHRRHLHISSVRTSLSPSAGVARSPQYAQLTADDIAHFRSILASPDTAVITDTDELAAVSIDWMKKYRGNAALLLRPASTAEVAAILHYCNERSLAVVPQGGNTGLVGGGVPLFDEIVLSLARLNRIVAMDEVSGIVTVQAGCILEQLSNYLDPLGYIVPLDLGAKGTCHIGGNIATNAGGLRLVRYGSLHGSVLGLEVVTAEGRIVDMQSTLRKDNTGYDLKQLFVGSEGTLGVITTANILTPRKPTSVHVAFLALHSFQAVLDVMVAARTQLSDIVSAIEFLDRPSMELVLKHIPGSRDPLTTPHPFYMLIETSGTRAEHDADKLNTFLEAAMAESQVDDGVVAQDDTQMKALWVLREHITDALGKQGTVYKYDISVPVHQFYEFVDHMRQRLTAVSGRLRLGVVGYGHLGDSNLHLNVWNEGDWDRELFELIEPWLFERVKAARGSVSAEHGLGQTKAKYIGYSKSEEAVELMRAMKRMMDPKGILNPYKMLPAVGAQRVEPGGRTHTQQ